MPARVEEWMPAQVGNVLPASLVQSSQANFFFFFAPLFHKSSVFHCDDSAAPPEYQMCKVVRRQVLTSGGRQLSHSRAVSGNLRLYVNYSWEANTLKIFLGLLSLHSHQFLAYKLPGPSMRLLQSHVSLECNRQSVAIFTPYSVGSPCVLTALLSTMSDELILTVTLSDGELDDVTKSNEVMSSPDVVPSSTEVMSSHNAVPLSTKVMLSPNAMPLRKRPLFQCRRRRGITRISPWRSIQQYNHRHGMAALCFRNHAYCLTNGITSYVVQNDPDFERKLLQHVADMKITTLCLTDTATQVRWRLVHKTNDISVILLNNDVGDCPTCKRNCVRWVAVCGLNFIRKIPIECIPHH
ncbi:hypothetical protein HNY73_001647 [Argiope bruennichi]|uniref:Uncharacterized protein n=1 Tax=Argiope bruennichi TaxID=94029 RepID=A0A8T0FVK3_ARGBR|nr:hypothetical protein HNY73_001647 [Argiope bruennichi]